MNFFRNLDFYPKIQENCGLPEKKGSLFGACIFLATLSLMTVLFITEVDAFLFGDNMTEPFISNSDANERMRVNLNMSFYQIPCAAISLDY